MSANKNMPPFCREILKKNKPPSSQKHILQKSPLFQQERVKRPSLPTTSQSGDKVNGSFMFQNSRNHNNSGVYTQIKRNMTWSQNYIMQDVITVLRQENVNLKEQNDFLISKLRAISQKQEEARKKAQKNQKMSIQLRQENQKLRHQIKYVNQITNNKVQQFGRKLQELSSAQQPNNKISEYLPFSSELSQSPVQQKFSQSYIQVKKLQQQGGVSETVAQLNQKFQQILGFCHQEKDSVKKKQYRKMLVELTDKIRSIQK